LLAACDTSKWLPTQRSCAESEQTQSLTLRNDLPNPSTRIDAVWRQLRTRTHSLQFAATEAVSAVIHAKSADHLRVFLDDRKPVTQFESE
jgi:hypothetical protein